MRYTCDGNTCGSSGIEAGQGTSTTSWVTSTAYLHDRNGWLQTNIDSGADAPKERMTVQEWQDKLLEKLNLDGLSEWTPRNASITRELLLSYHDAFVLEPDELGCTSAIEHEICLSDEEPFKERFRRIPPPLLDKVRASLRDMLEAGAIRPSQSPWCNAIVLMRKKDGPFGSALTFNDLMHGQRRTPIHCPEYKKHWRVWLERHIFPLWTSKVDSDKSVWPRNHSSILPLRLAI